MCACVCVCARLCPIVSSATLEALKEGFIKHSSTRTSVRLNHADC